MLFTVNKNTNRLQLSQLLENVQMLQAEFNKSMNGASYQEYFLFIIGLGKQLSRGSKVIESKEMTTLWHKGVVVADNDTCTIHVSLVPEGKDAVLDIKKRNKDILKNETSITYYGQYLKGRKWAWVPFIHNEYRWRFQVSFKDHVVGRKMYIHHLLTHLKIGLKVSMNDKGNPKISEHEAIRINPIVNEITRITQ